MKKLLSLLLTLGLLLSLTACGKGKEYAAELQIPQLFPAEHFEEPSALPETQAATVTATQPQRQIALVPVSDPVLSTSASSTYSGDRATHDVANLLDGDGKTNWTEGVQGDGIGQYVQFDFRDTYELVSVTIRAGNHFDKDRYINNSRPENITVTFSDGTSISCTLRDVMEDQLLCLSAPVTTSSVRITIDSAYHGYLYEDTVISDVFFEAYSPVYG